MLVPVTMKARDLLPQDMNYLASCGQMLRNLQRKRVGLLLIEPDSVSKLHTVLEGLHSLLSGMLPVPNLGQVVYQSSIKRGLASRWPLPAGWASFSGCAILRPAKTFTSCGAGRAKCSIAFMQVCAAHTGVCCAEPLQAEVCLSQCSTSAPTGCAS